MLYSIPAEGKSSRPPMETELPELANQSQRRNAGSQRLLKVPVGCIYERGWWYVYNTKGTEVSVLYSSLRALCKVDNMSADAGTVLAEFLLDSKIFFRSDLGIPAAHALG